MNLASPLLFSFRTPAFPRTGLQFATMGFTPGQAAVPATISERSARPPWRPLVAGVAGFLCGPLAAALIAFINLNRLEQRRKAAWILGLTVLACIGLGVAVAKLPDTTSALLARLLGNLVSPALFPLLQRRAFEDWQTSHPQATHDNGWRSCGWAILGLTAFFVITIGSAIAIASNEEAQNIAVRYTVPASVKVGERFEFTIAVENTADHPQLLHDLEFETHFLEGILIDGTIPAFRKIEPNPLAPSTSYAFQRQIPAKGSISINMRARARKAGGFPLTVHVCVQTALKCSTFELKTITV